MSTLKVKYPSNCDALLKLNTAISSYVVDQNYIIIGMDNNSRFAVFELLVNAEYIQYITHFEIDITTSDAVDNWTKIFKWLKQENHVFPSFIFEQPIVCYKMKITCITDIPNAYENVFPGIGIDYMSDGLMITDPPLVDIYEFIPDKIVNKAPLLKIEENSTENNDNNQSEEKKPYLQLYQEVWFTLKREAMKIYKVYCPGSTIVFKNKDIPVIDTTIVFQYAGTRSKYEEGDEIDVFAYKYDPVSECIIFNALTFDGVESATIFCEYISGDGCKVTVPVEAVDFGPMFDVDVSTIISIHADDYAKLPQETDDNPISWQVINNTEMQGGYQYWNSSYVDAVHLAFKMNKDDPHAEMAYRGSGINFQKIGGAPDAFDKNVEDYRSLWVSDDNKFVPGMWQTKARGYVTFIGPPNSIVPPGIRVFAPASVRNDNAMSGTTDLSAPRIPNGGMLPAPLIVKLHTSTKTDFPPDSGFYRKCAAFKPKVMIYLRERTKYNGATHWKDIGEGFGNESEITGVPYWL